MANFRNLGFALAGAAMVVGMSVPVSAASRAGAAIPAKASVSVARAGAPTSNSNKQAETPAWVILAAAALGISVAAYLALRDKS